MSNATLDMLVWGFIYAGLFVAGLGIWFLKHSTAAGWTLAVVGAGLVGVGALLIWIRSRRA